MAGDHLRHCPEPARLLHPRRTGSAREASQHRDGSGDHILPPLRPSFSGDKHTYTSAYFGIMGRQGGSYTHVAAQHSRSGSTGGGHRQVVSNAAPEARTTSSSANFPTVGAPSHSSQPELSSRVDGSSLSKVPCSQMIRDTTSSSAVAGSSPQDVDRHSCPSKGNKSNVEFGEQGLFVEQHGSHPLINNPPVRHGRFPDSSPFRIPSSPYRDSDDNHTMRRGPRDHLEDSLLPQKDLRDLLFPGDEDDSVKRCSARGVSGFAVEDDESEDEDDRVRLQLNVISKGTASRGTTSNIKDTAAAETANRSHRRTKSAPKSTVKKNDTFGLRPSVGSNESTSSTRIRTGGDMKSTDQTTSRPSTRPAPSTHATTQTSQSRPGNLGGSMGLSVTTRMAIRATKPQIRVVTNALPREASSTRAQASNSHQGGTSRRVEPRSSTTSNDGPATEAPLRREAHRAAREPPSSSIASTTSVLNQRSVDPNALGLIPINTLPGPLYEPDFPVARVPDRESYAGFPHDNFPLNNNQSTPTGAAGGRRRSNTLPTVNELDHGVSQFDDSCADYCPSTPGLYQNIDIHNRASPAAISGALSDDEGSARRRSTFRQSEDPHTPMRKGRARIFTGNLQPVSETKIVEGFRSPDGWRRAPKRPAERVLSPLSYNKGPERKRAVKRTEHKSQSGSKNGQAKGRDGAGSQNARSTMVQHIVNIADRLDGNEAAPASEDDDDESRRGYTQNASDHVKTHHRPAGPMEKQRRSGIAQLQNQREAKKEKKLPVVSSPAEK
ncbi:hypothetical protein CKAH01_09683 [Colletotrichum kahawae]|uniref:Uncharacterized protein n=1 Tax=Colletotrichum kahawae TaxID=34407 RepID=A0AAD9XXN0_COLKA|nr:hypothetical protein CKAH01_09683 [Colletotrichum kahawae]